MSCHNSWNFFLGSCAVLCPYPNLPVCASASKSLKSPHVCDMQCPCNISVVFSIWHLDYVFVPSLRSVGKILATVLIWINAKESEQDDFPPSLFVCLPACRSLLVWRTDETFLLESVPSCCYLVMMFQTNGCMCFMAWLIHGDQIVLLYAYPLFII